MQPEASRKPKRNLEAMASLSCDAQREHFFELRKELVSPEEVSAICSEVARLVSTDLRKASNHAGTACWLAERLDNDVCRARSLRAEANALHFSGKPRDAHRSYSTSLRLFLALGDELEAAITQSSALLNLAYLGKYEEALGWAESARAVFSRRGDRARLAILDNNLASLHYRQDRWQEALSKYQSAHATFCEQGRLTEAAICLRNTAVCRVSLLCFEEGFRAYAEAEEFCQRHGLSQLHLEVQYNVAYLHYLRGEYGKAMTLFRGVKEQALAQGDSYHEALCDLDLSEMYLELNLPEDAAALARASKRTFAAQSMGYEMAKAALNLAIAESCLGRSNLALKLLVEARTAFAAEANQHWLAYADVLRALVERRRGNHREAMEWVDVARKQFKDQRCESRAALCEVLQAEMALEEGDTETARDTCRRALRKLRELELPELSQRAYAVAGRIAEERGERDAALTAYRASEALLERLRSRLSTEDLRVSLLKQRSSVYEGLVRLTLESDDEVGPAEHVFCQIEAAKSRSLSERLRFRSRRLSRCRKAPVRLSRRLLELREELNWFYREIDAWSMKERSYSRDHVEHLREAARRREGQLIRARRELEAADPELGALQLGGRATLEEVRESLPAHATLIEYFMARGRVLAVLVDRERVSVHDLAPVEEVQRLHCMLRFQFSRQEPSAFNGPTARILARDAIRDHLHRLYLHLVAPIRQRFDREQLIVVPHDFLHALPFHALFDGRKYLSEEHVISYAPSASVFHYCSDRRPGGESAENIVIGFEDERAPNLVREAEDVAELLPEAKLVVGQKLSASDLRRYADARYIHVACHGLYRRDNPMFSALQLGRERVSLFDLYDLRLRADLVVLSGCDTGLGSSEGADEIVGLSRGLLFAGARSVVVSLWRVSDESTRMLMRSFYERLRQTPHRSRALHAAMGEVRRESPDPYHWAPFVLIGDPGP